MGFTRKMKAIALAAAILLLGLAAAACSGSDGDSSSSSSSKDLVPQRANVVGSLDVDQLLDAIDMDLAQVFGLLPADSSGALEGIDELFNADPASIQALFGDVSRVDIFAEADVEGESEYFGVILRGSFDETPLIVGLEALTGRGLDKEEYKGINIYSLEDDDDEVTLSVLDSGAFALGQGGAVKDIIDLRNGDTDSASGPLVDVFEDLRGGVFGFAAKVPQDSFQDEDLGSVPGLGDLPISLDFLSSLDIVGLGGNLNNGTLDISVNLDFTDEEAAETLEGFIRGIVTLASGFSSDPRMTELMSSLEIDQDGTRLTITIAIPESDLIDIFSDLTTVASTSTSTSSGSLPPGTPEIRLLPVAIGEEVVLMPDANHVTEGETVAYSTTPPTSGSHWGRWADCGWYPDGLPDEVITHNLEHGNIVISYNLTNPAQVSALREALDGVSQFGSWGVARSYDEIPDGQIALSAWGRFARSQVVNAEEIKRFFDAFAGQLGPERIAC